MPLQENATVTKVVDPGAASGVGSDDWDAAADAPTEKWTGSVRAYYREKIDRRPGVDVLVIRTLIIDTADYDDLGIDTDDIVTFTVDGAAQTTGTAALVSVARLAGIASDLQTTRIELAAA